MFFEKNAGEYRGEPVVHYCGFDKNLKPGAHYGPVKRDIFLIECCVSGYGKIVINDKAFSITPRSCYFLLPGDSVKHFADEKEPREGCWCAVDGMQVASALKSAGITSDSPFAPPEAFDDINAHLEELYRTRSENDLGANFRRVAHIYGILGALLRTGASMDKNYWVQKAIGYMQTNYYEDISVASLAAEIGLDRSYFSTLFKTQTGMSPYSYLTCIRVNKAAALINEGSYAMAEVAEMVGLDPQNFARLFKRKIGKSPREYKKAKEGENSAVDIYRGPGTL